MTDIVGLLDAPPTTSVRLALFPQPAREGYSIESPIAATSPVRCSIDAVGRVGRQVPDEDRHLCGTVTPPMVTGGEYLVRQPVQRYDNRGEGIAQDAARSLEVAYRNGGGFSNATVRGSDIPRGWQSVEGCRDDQQGRHPSDIAPPASHGPCHGPRPSWESSDPRRDRRGQRRRDWRPCISASATPAIICAV